MKFETVRIHFLSDVFGLWSFKIFATMATWRNNFSLLIDEYIVIVITIVTIVMMMMMMMMMIIIIIIIVIIIIILITSSKFVGNIKKTFDPVISYLLIGSHWASELIKLLSHQETPLVQERTGSSWNPD